ncbi:hypothetical protein AOV_04895 [Anaplasma ovis str. Haibei]|uniref:Uncharacterized protein n=1 Tax=Anaplasma ovis str. Haibei TaxID=1248439 RepID=A0A2Z2LCE5_9RICK|nr:hypothetical protein AOV_04895 [Anaplasma ovis str. Haibei]
MAVQGALFCHLRYSLGYFMCDFRHDRGSMDTGSQMLCLAHLLVVCGARCTSLSGFPCSTQGLAENTRGRSVVDDRVCMAPVLYAAGD